MRVPKEVKAWYRKIGRKGGQVRSAVKTRAVRKNGKLGGRPRKPRRENQ
jgi:hypothetical protein